MCQQLSPEYAAMPSSCSSCIPDPESSPITVGALTAPPGLMVATVHPTYYQWQQQESGNEDAGREGTRRAAFILLFRLLVGTKSCRVWWSRALPSAGAAWHAGSLLVPVWAGGRAQSRDRAAPGCQMSVLASDRQEGLHLNQQELSGLRTMAGGYF